jgi:hypothetical protein
MLPAHAWRAHGIFNAADCANRKIIIFNKRLTVRYGSASKAAKNNRRRYGNMKKIRYLYV